MSTASDIGRWCAMTVSGNGVTTKGDTLSVGFADSSPIGRAKPWVFCLRMRGRLPFSERPAYRRTAVVAATASPLALPLGELSPQVTEREFRVRLLFPMLRRFRHNAAAAGERSSPLRDVWLPERRVPPGTVSPPYPREGQTPPLRRFSVSAEHRTASVGAGLALPAVRQPPGSLPPPTFPPVIPRRSRPTTSTDRVDRQ